LIQHIEDADRETYRTNLTQVLDKYSGDGLGDPLILTLLHQALNFVQTQTDEFKKEYIKAFIDDCTQAYTGSADALSCVGGIRERIISSVYNALATVTCRPENFRDCPEEIKRLICIFEADRSTTQISFFQKQAFENMTGVTKEENIAHFRKFMTEKIQSLRCPPTINLEVLITELDELLMFEPKGLQAGGNLYRKYKKYKEKYMKTI